MLSASTTPTALVSKADLVREGQRRADRSKDHRGCREDAYCNRVAPFWRFAEMRAGGMDLDERRNRIYSGNCHNGRTSANSICATWRWLGDQFGET